jgi:N-acetyl sugar amidotransferase
MDETSPNIAFDIEGRCNFCRDAEIQISNLKIKKNSNSFIEIVKDVRKNKKKYNCIIGVSGGVDSTYLAKIVKDEGLNPIAIHFDNGWNSELAVSNIEKTLKKLDIPLITYVVNWDEFKDLQLSFLKASVPDGEIPTDHAIIALLYKYAAKFRIKHILAGTNTETESILPPEWSQGHWDFKYIHSIQKMFGTQKLKTYPRITLLKYFYYRRILNIKWISLLDYIDYNKNIALNVIEKEFNYKQYQYKHFESNYTKFFQGFILPKKFKIDKRKAHLSSLIISNQIERSFAINELSKDIFSDKEINEQQKHIVSKFDISIEEFDNIMNLPVKNYKDYLNSKNSSKIKILYIITKSIRRIFANRGS